MDCSSPVNHKLLLLIYPCVPVPARMELIFAVEKRGHGQHLEVVLIPPHHCWGGWRGPLAAVRYWPLWPNCRWSIHLPCTLLLILLLFLSLLHYCFQSIFHLLGPDLYFLCRQFFSPAPCRIGGGDVSKQCMVWSLSVGIPFLKYSTPPPQWPNPLLTCDKILLLHMHNRVTKNVSFLTFMLSCKNCSDLQWGTGRDSQLLVPCVSQDFPFWIHPEHKSAENVMLPGSGAVLSS